MPNEHLFVNHIRPHPKWIVASSDKTQYVSPISETHIGLFNAQTHTLRKRLSGCPGLPKILLCLKMDFYNIHLSRINDVVIAYFASGADKILIWDLNSGSLIESITTNAGMDVQCITALDHQIFIGYKYLAYVLVFNMTTPLEISTSKWSRPLLFRGRTSRNNCSLTSTAIQIGKQSKKIIIGGGDRFDSIVDVRCLEGNTDLVHFNVGCAFDIINILVHHREIDRKMTPELICLCSHPSNRNNLLFITPIAHIYNFSSSIAYLKNKYITTISLPSDFHFESSLESCGDTKVALCGTSTAQETKLFIVDLQTMKVSEKFLGVERLGTITAIVKNDAAHSTSHLLITSLNGYMLEYAVKTAQVKDAISINCDDNNSNSNFIINFNNNGYRTAIIAKEWVHEFNGRTLRVYEHNNMLCELALPHPISVIKSTWLLSQGKKRTILMFIENENTLCVLDCCDKTKCTKRRLPNEFDGFNSIESFDVVFGNNSAYKYITTYSKQSGEITLYKLEYTPDNIQLTTVKSLTIVRRLTTATGDAESFITLSPMAGIQKFREKTKEEIQKSGGPNLVNQSLSFEAFLTQEELLDLKVGRRERQHLSITYKKSCNKKCIICIINKTLLVVDFDTLKLVKRIKLPQFVKSIFPLSINEQLIVFENYFENYTTLILRDAQIEAPSLFNMAMRTVLTHGVEFDRKSLPKACIPC